MISSSDSPIRVRPADPALERSLLKAGVPPLASAILSARGIADPRPLLGGRKDKLECVNGGGAAAAAAAIASAVTSNRRMCLLCDFDADGVCAAAIMSTALQQLSANYCVRFCRRGEERGISPRDVEEIASGCASMIVTADNGISAHAAATRAKDLNVTLVITDHHEPPEELPDCLAIANPMLPESGFPAQELCGAAVALLVMRETVRRLGARVNLGHLSDLAALATIADVMPMDDPVNRQIVADGLSLIRQGRCRVGIKAILGERRVSDCTTSDISHRLAPAINSAGRLDQPERAYACLMSNSMGDANELAQELAGYNRQRKELTAKAVKEAAEQAEERNLPFCLACGPDWPSGVIGLVASKLAFATGKPAVVVGKAGTALRGSMRSVPGISVHEILYNINRDNPGLLSSFGGHQAAAGFTLRGEFSKLEGELIREFERAAEQAPPPEPVVADAEPSVSDLCDGSVEYLAAMPWGRKFPAPQFLGTFLLTDIRAASSGNGFNHYFDLGGEQIVAWNGSELARPGQQLRMLYRTSAARRGDKPPLLFVVSSSRLEADQPQKRPVAARL